MAHKGQWRPGESGNPKGKPRGTLSASTKLRKLINVKAIIRQLQDDALKGDVQAARTLLERALPVYRAAAEPVDLPDLAAATELTDKARVVLNAVADGRVPPDVGSQLVAAIGSVSKLTEVDELERRITALEQKNAKP